MTTEYELVAQIQSMFAEKQNRDLEALHRMDRELRPLLVMSQQSLKGLVDVNMLMPQSTKAR